MSGPHLPSEIPSLAQILAQPITVHLEPHLGGWVWSGYYSQGLLECHLGLYGGGWTRFGRHGGERLTRKFERMIQRERAREARRVDIEVQP